MVSLSAAPHETETLRLLKDLAGQGNTEAQYLLALEYQDGVEVKPNAAEAEKWLRRAAEGGHAGAQFALGAFYAGYGGEADQYALAVKWYQAAASSGHPEAISRLGALLAKGGRRGPPDLAIPAKDSSKVEAAASPANSSPAEHAMVRESADETVRWSLILSALRGPDAWLVRGFMLENGIAMEKGPEAAAANYRAAAEAGHALGCYHLGLAYAHGKGVPRDRVEACMWLRLAKDRGAVAAEEALARWESELTAEQKVAVLQRLRAHRSGTPQLAGDDPGVRR